jgi:16S rRNA (adenine1518-N6/adenine1519-N6)-dimethyltransferase
MDTRALLREWSIRPAKQLGQNFLVDKGALRRIVEGAEIDDETLVLEVGAGLGALTELLCRQAKHVVAVELDKRLVPILHQVLEDAHNLTLVQGDILELDPASLVLAQSGARAGESLRYVVVANLPYYITSAVIRHLLETQPRAERLVLTVQREVAERIVAEPGELSLLALSVQLFGTPRVLFRIKPGSFYPSPGVESAVVRVDIRSTPELGENEMDAIFRLARAGFSQRRKQLRNSLSAGLQLSRTEVASRLEEVGIEPRRRAQSLSIQEWKLVADVLGGEGGPV